MIASGKKLFKGVWKISGRRGKTALRFGRNAENRDEPQFVPAIFKNFQLSPYFPIRVRYLTLTSPTRLRPMGISVPSTSVTSPFDTRWT